MTVPAPSSTGPQTLERRMDKERISLFNAEIGEVLCEFFVCVMHLSISFQFSVRIFFQKILSVVS